MIMTENYINDDVLPRYKIKEDPAGLQDYDSHNLNLLGFENDVPMLTLQESQVAVKVNKESPDKVKSAVKSWNGKKLIIKSEGVVNSKLLVVKYKNGKKIEVPGPSCNISLGSNDKKLSSPEPKSITKPPPKVNYHVYNMKTKTFNLVGSESGSNVASDHNYFTARRKSTESLNLVDSSVVEVKKNRSLSMSVQNLNESKKKSDKALVEYKLFNRHDLRENIPIKPQRIKPVPIKPMPVNKPVPIRPMPINKPVPKQVEALKIVKIIKPQLAPPPLEIIRPVTSKVYHNKKILPIRVDGFSQTTTSTTDTIGVNTDESLLKELIDARVEELRQPVDLDADLESCFQNFQHIFNCNEDLTNPFLNVQPNGTLMDLSYTNGGSCNVIGQNLNSGAMDWKKQLFIDLKKCDIVDMSGNRPLHLAVMQNNDKLVKRNCIALKARDIDINFTNNENLTALQLALMHNADVVVVETLLRNHCDTQVSDAEGNNILHLAVLYSNEDVVRLLVSTPDLCDVNACNFEGYTPLILCIINKRYVMADLLLSFDADPNIGDKKSGRTALFHAVEANDAEMVKLLINHKALTKVKNYFGTSPHDAMFELDSIDATIRKLVLNRDDVSSARPKIARGKRKRSSVVSEGDGRKMYKP